MGIFAKNQPAMKFSLLTVFLYNQSVTYKLYKP